MIPFSPPRVDKKTTDAVTAVLLSGWITSGPKTKEFESKLADYSGNPTTLCLNSATAGLELVLRWFGGGPGDEVITVAHTYFSFSKNSSLNTSNKKIYLSSSELL